VSTILLVEDHEDNRIVYRTVLEHFGYTVLEAHDGEEGVRRAREDRPDLVLMDISIPKLDGWEATRVLKSDPKTARIPVIALTAHALPEDRARAAEAGCDGYLAKPVEPRRVVEEVRRVLDGRSDPAE
jgi:two-component system, cell cycle response regulator DivK